MAARESFNGSFGPSYLEIPRDVLDFKVDLTRAVIPRAGKYRASTRASAIRPHRSAGRPAGEGEEAGYLARQQVWTCQGSAIAREFVR